MVSPNVTRSVMPHRSASGGINPGYPHRSPYARRVGPTVSLQHASTARRRRQPYAAGPGVCERTHSTTNRRRERIRGTRSLRGTARRSGSREDYRPARERRREGADPGDVVLSSPESVRDGAAQDAGSVQQVPYAFLAVAIRLPTFSTMADTVPGETCRRSGYDNPFDEPRTISGREQPEQRCPRRRVPPTAVGGRTARPTVLGENRIRGTH